MESHRQGTADSDPSVVQMIGSAPSPPPPQPTRPSTDSYAAHSDSAPAPTLHEPQGNVHSPESFAPLLKKLIADPDNFSLADTRLAFNHLAEHDGAHHAQIGAFLAALRLTGKDGQPAVVAECARVMQDHACKVDIQHSAGGSEEDDGPVCDIVGTGGDGHNTFNVSTTAAIVAAGAGLRVYKVR